MTLLICAILALSTLSLGPPTRIGTYPDADSTLAVPADVRQGREGWIAYAEYGSYVAIALGPGVAITVCGPGGCIDTVSTDAGPNRAMLQAGRIMDLDRAKWRAVCGMSTTRGLCWGEWHLAVPEARPRSEPRMTLPPTDTVPTDAP